MEEAQQGSNGTESQTTVIPTSQFPQVAQQEKKTPFRKYSFLNTFLHYWCQNYWKSNC